MVFRRPPTIPMPTIWHRFSVSRGGVLHQLRIQDLTEEQKEDAVNMLKTYFMADEPPCKYIGISKYPEAMHQLEQLWRTTLEHQVSLVCVVDDEEAEMVGVNALCVACHDDKKEEFQSEDKTWAALFGAVDAVSQQVDVFQHYGVEKYLTAYGLTIDRKWRGLGIGKELLKARIPLCKALGINATATVFTAASSQAVAKKAGFEDLFELTYEELAAKGFVFPGIEEDTKSSKLMGLKIE